VRQRVAKNPEVDHTKCCEEQQRGWGVDAVLRAAGHQVRRSRTWPGGYGTGGPSVTAPGQGMSHKEIAKRLVISPKTASNYIEHIYAKIGVSNRAMASLFATGHGLL
jgi:Bacterial regulatory proteins, luxR family